MSSYVHPVTRIAKRSADLITAVGGLIVLSPLLPLIALAIRLDSPGPILFRQPRTGQDGEEIAILKFRTLKPAAPVTAPEGTVVTGSTRTWWRVGPALAEAGWRVKAPDLPAHGASPRVDRALTPDGAVGTVVNVRALVTWRDAPGAAVESVAGDNHYAAALQGVNR